MAYIGVDVGTGSVRCAAFDKNGKILTSPVVKDISQTCPKPGYYQQSSEEIWNTVCENTKVVLTDLKSRSIEVKGIGFDATCSLVVLDSENQGVSVDPTDEHSKYDIILWMDHRAKSETEILNSKPTFAHKYVGGKFSPEMELPKLMWLKKNLPDRWRKIKNCFDLADFLTFKCTGELTYSTCTLTCKWGWIPSGKNSSNGDWEDELVRNIDLTELKSLVSGRTLFPGQPVGTGISESASTQIGLPVGTPVATGMIDAHAGALGVLATGGAKEASGKNRMGLIAGTSCCHMMMIENEKLVEGVWGPYLHAVLPNQYLLEGGQTTAGSTLDWLSKFTGRSLEQLASNVENLQEIEETSDVLVISDLQGNRAPLADPSIKGSIHGITLQTTPVEVYIGTLTGLAIGTRHIIERIKAKTGVAVDELVITGGLIKSPAYNKIHANACQVPVILPETENGVLLGSAMLAAVASGDFEDLVSAQQSMSSAGQKIMPEKSLAERYAQKTKRHFKNLTFKSTSHQ